MGPSNCHRLCLFFGTRRRERQPQTGKQNRPNHDFSCLTARKGGLFSEHREETAHCSRSRPRNDPATPCRPLQSPGQSSHPGRKRTRPLRTAGRDCRDSLPRFDPQSINPARRARRSHLAELGACPTGELRFLPDVTERRVQPCPIFTGFGNPIGTALRGSDRGR